MDNPVLLFPQLSIVILSSRELLMSNEVIFYLTVRDFSNTHITLNVHDKIVKDNSKIAIFGSCYVTFK